MTNFVIFLSGHRATTPSVRRPQVRCGVFIRKKTDDVIKNGWTSSISQKIEKNGKKEFAGLEYPFISRYQPDSQVADYEAL